MALDIDYWLDTALPVGEVAGLVVDGLRAQGGFPDAIARDDLLGDGVSQAAGAVCGLRAVEPSPLGEVADDLGLRATARVWWRLAADGDERRQLDSVVGVVAQLLRDAAGDAALIYLDETVMLLRRGEELQVLDRDDLWPPARQALLPEPVQRARLAFPN